MAIEKNLVNLERLLSLMDADTLTKETFAQSFQTVVNFVLKIEKQIIEKNNKEIRENLNELTGTVTKKLSEVKNGVDGKDGIDGRSGIDGKEGKDGVDGNTIDENVVVDKVIVKLPIDDFLNPSPENHRDNLESLKGNERLDINAIKGLLERLETLEKKPTFGGRAIGPSVILKFLNNISPVGAIDGSNAVYTLPKAPKTDSEKVFLNGVRMRSGSSNDYTIAGRTLTFTFNPLTDDVILVDIEH